MTDTIESVIRRAVHDPGQIMARLRDQGPDGDEVESVWMWASRAAALAVRAHLTAIGVDLPADLAPADLPADVPAPWWEAPFLVFDTETTGPDPEVDRIVSAHVSLSSPAGAGWVLDLLADPGMDIPEGATAVHGITTEHVREHGRPIWEVLEQLLAHLAAADLEGLPVVAYNGSFDFTILDRECRRNGLDPFAPSRVIDPYVLDKQVDPYRRGKRTLTDTTRHYGVTLDGAHEASADAVAAGDLARAIARKYPLHPDLDVLAAQQTRWRASQCASLETYLRTKGNQPEAVVDGTWPVHPFAAPNAAAVAP